MRSAVPQTAPRLAKARECPIAKTTLRQRRRSRLATRFQSIIAAPAVHGSLRAQAELQLPSAARLLWPEAYWPNWRRRSPTPSRRSPSEASRSLENASLPCSRKMLHSGRLSLWSCSPDSDGPVRSAAPAPIYRLLPLSSQLLALDSQATGFRNRALGSASPVLEPLAPACSMARRSRPSRAGYLFPQTQAALRR